MLSFYRSLSVREIAFVNVCWFRLGNQSPRCLRYFSAVMLGEQKLSSSNMARLHWLGSVKLRKTFRQIYEVWENAETLSLEKCLLSLCPITLQFLDVIRWIVFDWFLFYFKWQCKRSITDAIRVQLQPKVILKEFLKSDFNNTSHP